MSGSAMYAASGTALVREPIFLWPSREGGGEMLDARELGVLDRSLLRDGTASAEGGEIERKRLWFGRARVGGVGYPWLILAEVEDGSWRGRLGVEYEGTRAGDRPRASLSLLNACFLIIISSRSTICLRMGARNGSR